MIDPMGNMDANAWVEAWLENRREYPEVADDPGAMLSWFASAIMTGYGNARVRTMLDEAGASSISEYVDQLKYRRINE